MKIGIIREGKVPPDRRVPMSPEQCARVQKEYPDVEILVQSSPIRKYTDTEYANVGLKVVDSLEECDLILGVKEVPIDMLIPGKTYVFFSHTIKEQPYNRDLLRAILDKKITLIDYEVITDEKGHRLIGFGRYAGIVGCYNAFRAYGLKSGRYDLKPAHECEDRREMEEELSKVDIPSDYKIVLTGLGRVGKGAVEVLEKLGLKEVNSKEFVEGTFDEPVWTRLSVTDYNARGDGSDFHRYDFYNDPTGYHSTFMKYAKVADMYVACHYWDADSPFIFTRDDMKNPDWKIGVVADISCDIDGPVACTIHPSTISDPVYGYNVLTELDDDYHNDGVVAVMAVDNLPCELPKDASEDFGNELIKDVLPHLLDQERSDVIRRATITDSRGNLTKEFSYLEGYVKNRNTVPD